MIFLSSTFPESCRDLSAACCWQIWAPRWLKLSRRLRVTIVVSGDRHLLAESARTSYPSIETRKAGASLADVVAGLYALNGILLALLARYKTGTGQHVDISLLDGMVSTLTYQALIYLSTGRSPRRLGTRHPSIVPYECFQAKDGFVNIAVTNEKQWENFCRALGFAELAIDPRFQTMEARLTHYGELRPVIDRVISKMTRAEAIARMSEVGIPAGPINTIGEILEDPQIKAREMIVELTHPEYGPFRTLGIPIKLST